MKNNMKKVRIEKGMTQEDLSRITDTSLTQIRNIENGRSIPSVLTAIKIKKALNVNNIEELFDE